MAQRPATGPSLNLRGAVDLSGLSQKAPAAAAPATAAAHAAPTQAAPAAAPAAGGSAPGSTPAFVDVTEANVQAVVSESMSLPILLHFTSASSPQCQQLATTLKKLVIESGGKFVLATVDVTAEPRLPQIFGVQSAPTVIAVLKGNPIPLFQGNQPAEQLKSVLDELALAAEKNGMTGRADVGTAEVPAEPEIPPLHAAAEEALMANDLDAAEAAYTKAIAEQPQDDEAVKGLARVHLLQRIGQADAQGVREAVAADPKNVDANLDVADLDIVGGHIGDAFDRLIQLVKTTFGDDRDRIRVRLVEYFTIIGDEDERVPAARRALASALF